MTKSAGQKLRDAIAAESPLQIVGTINANHALLAERAGYKAIYLSGGGVAAGSLGLPDLGISTLEDVLVDVRRIGSFLSHVVTVVWLGLLSLTVMVMVLDMTRGAGLAR